MLEMAEIFKIFFLTFISLFFLIAYLVRFNTNCKRHFLIKKLVYSNKQLTQRFHLLNFPCLLERMVLALLMMTETNF